MELREFAEKVLFAKTLEEKLQCPGVITDEHPGSALVTPEAPGRPTELRFKAHASGKAEFPGIHQLEQERERGKLLHFFANHELLATELMALVLLKFPDAPAAFRKGVLETLKDEQMHTRLYIKRMKDSGIHFGDMPVNGYFWRTVSAMENPMDYVSSLSLTFEQANLDFCKYFAGKFQSVGDASTAKLLEKIYRDEIGHVAYGLKWFRKWKNPGESDWDAFCRQLKFPLSPQRAKGIALNVEGRRMAGLEPEFIAELNVYSQSKGRTPGVFVFNPFAEGRIAEGKTFNPVKSQAMLARDLANLPQFLCRQDDIVLLEKRPSIEFLSSLKQVGFDLPEFIELKKGKIDKDSLLNRKIGRLRPWAWSPDSIELLSPLFANVTGEKRMPGECFNEKIARLYSKAWSAAFLKKILSRHEAWSWLCAPDEVGAEVSSLDDAVAAIENIRERGHLRVVAKESVGLAGHNMMRLWEPELLDTQKRWMANVFAAGRQLVIEPWLERVVDFSVQLEMGASGLKLCGFTGLINDAKGQFRANWAEIGHHKRIPVSVVRAFSEPRDISRRMLDLYGEIVSMLEEEFKRAGYLGPAGIDAFVYRTTEGGVRLKPVVEINPRYTMGRLTVELMNHASQGSHGLFRLVNRSMAGTEGFEAYARALEKQFPLRFEGEPVRKISEGVIYLNDPAHAQAVLAIYQVSRDLEQLIG